SAAHLFRLGGELHRRKGRAMDAITPRAATHDYNQIARPYCLPASLHGNKTHRAAEDQGVAQVALVEANLAVDRGDTHAVAIIRDAGHYPVDDLHWMQHAGGQRLCRRVRRRETEDIGVTDRLSAQASAERVPDDTAEPCIGAAIRFDG